MSTRVPTITENREVDHGFEDSSDMVGGSSKKGAAFARPKLMKRASETEQKLAEMRQRFMTLQMMEESDAAEKTYKDDTYKDSPVLLPSTANSASARWTRLRKVVKWQAGGEPPASSSSKKVGLLTFSVDDSVSGDSAKISPRISPRGGASGKRKILKRPPSEGSVKKKMEAEQEAASIELEDIGLSKIWTDDSLPELPDTTSDLPTFSLISEIEELKSDLYSDLFNEESKQLKVSVSRIPEEIVNERKAEVERIAQEERLIMLEKLRKREEDIDFRENTARDALRTKEQEAQQRLDAEKQKAASLALRKQKKLSEDFRKMREDLEMGIKKQHGAIKENFGRLLVHEETLARRFHAASKMAPQPIEFRVHMLRAVKNKLPKGTYVLMLTQYDSVGGRPLSWSRIGSNGIGNMRPGITRMCRHEGRYFDRVLRVEDSCFALCPPRPLLKPNFVFVLELFQLASRHNPFDKIEAWTAVPMTYESMAIIEGKIKLPMLRGEHSPAVRQFKEMERLVATDLQNWLCNIYIEVRHMSLTELGATDEMLKTTDFDMDYFNKSFIPLDVNGNPILSREEQEQRALERDLEEAGFGAAEGSLSGGSPKKPKPSLLEDEDSEYKVPLLPVDKGIFRRKVGASSTAAAVDEEMGIPGTGVGGASAGAAVRTTDIDAQGSDKNSSSNNNNKEEVGTGDSKKALITKSSRLASIPEENRAASSSRSLLGIMGLKSNSDVNRPLLLKNDDNFLEHRKLLVQRWKDNIKSKGLDQSNHTNSFRDENGEKEEEVLERGYNIQDEVFLHREQRGKIAGVETIPDRNARQWAAAGLEGKIVRRWQSEGPRFDSEAIGDQDLIDGNNRAARQANREPTWEELRDVREMEDYTMAICTDAGKKKAVIPGAKSASKLRYIYMELFGDFNQYLWGTFEFYMSIGIYLFALWIRIYVHYLAQYLYLVSLNTPVYGFRLMVFQIVQKYMSLSISVAAETGVVAIGPIANLCVFAIFIGLGKLFHQLADYIPEVLSKFFAAFGIAAVLDPILVIIIDLIYHNYNCSAVSDACKTDYTSNDCKCFKGDFLKLWYRMEKEEGSGLTGLFIMLLLYMGTIIIGSLFLYQYIVYVHRDGRILDQWRRLNGTVEEFFIPDDFEVSEEELRTIIHKGIHWRGPKGSRRRLDVKEWVENDPDDPNYLETYKKYIIYEIDEQKNRSIFREFQMEPNGAILEIFEAKHAQNKNRSIFNTGAAHEAEPIDHTDREEVASKEDDEQEDEASEHTGNLSARRIKPSPRGEGGGGGSARSAGAAGIGALFPDLMGSFRGSARTKASEPRPGRQEDSRSEQKQNNNRESSRDSGEGGSEQVPLLGGGSSRRMPTAGDDEVDEMYI